MKRASKEKIIELDSLCFSYIIIATIIVDGTTELNTYKKNKSIILGKFTYGYTLLCHKNYTND